MRELLTRLVPRITLSDASFAARHRLIRGTLWATLALVLVIAAFTRHQAFGTGGSTGSTGSTGMGSHDSAANVAMLWSFFAVAVIGAVLAGLDLSRRQLAASCSTGLLFAAISLVHVSGGLTDMHFSFFVLLALTGLYQDWVPLVAAVLVVAVHHLVVGLIMPDAVFSDPRAQAHPVPWALLHTAFVIGMVLVIGTTWRFAAKAQEDATQAVEAAQSEAGRRLETAARDAAHREELALRDAAERLDERERIAVRLDGLLASTAATGQRIGGETESAMSEVNRALSRISEAAQTASADLDKALEDSSAARQVIGELERSIESIASVAQLIKNVAEQTNLLALNATIEAARAGEAGRGFGVVAQEVKSLASQTAAATARIETTVAQVRSDAGAVIGAVAAVGQVLDRVVGAQQQVRDIVEGQGERVDAAQVSLVAAAQEVAGAAEAARAAR